MTANPNRIHQTGTTVDVPSRANTLRPRSTIVSPTNGQRKIRGLARTSRSIPMPTTYDIVLSSPFHNYDFFAHRMRELCGADGPHLLHGG
jgi:hypothetical protein